MPSLEISHYNNIINFLNLKNVNFLNFIETGTYQAETILKFSTLFEKCYTIEIYEPFFQNALLKTKNSNIKCIFGDSSVELKNILFDKIENTVFWLDGHYSGQGTGRGKKSCPLIEEILTIDEYGQFKEGLIIIDDIRLLSTKVEGLDDSWEILNIDYLINLFKRYEVINKFLSESQISVNDRLSIHIQLK